MKIEILPVLSAQGEKTLHFFAKTKQTLITFFFGFLFLPLCTTAQPTPDPIWTTYYGGSLADLITGTTTDAAGNIYICGYTASTAGIAAGAGVHDNTHGGGTGYDAFVAKFSPTGLRLWGTYLGGTTGDQAYSIVTDGTSVYISGETSSTTGIAFGAGQFTTHGGGTSDGFVAKFNASNGAGIWGTYYGGTADDEIRGLALAPDGGLVFVGTTFSANTGNRIATPGALQTVLSGTQDGMLVKFNAAGTRLWGTYIGNTGTETAAALVIDGSGTIYIGGGTGSTTGISTPGTFQETFFSGVTEMYLMAINSTGTTKVWGTYWGGSGNENVRQIEIDPAGNLIVAGNVQSGSTGLASTGSYQPEPGGSHEIIIGKFTTSGQRIWATYFGGSRSDGLDYNGLDLDEDGNILLLSDGRPFSTTAPSSNLGTPCSYQTTWDPGGAGSSNGEWIITKLSNDGTTRKWTSYYGTQFLEWAFSITYIGDGKFVAAGSTQSNAFPGVAGSHQPTFGGTTDGLLALFSDGRAPAMTVMPTVLNPTSQTACILGIPQLITGNAVSYTTAATYYTSPVYYRWQSADAAAGPWTDMEGETFKDLQPLASQTNKYYRRVVLVSNGSCTQTPVDTSDVASVLINSDLAPVANANGPQWYVCATPNNTVTLNGSATGGSPGYTYQWFVGSATTPAVVTANYTPTVTTPTTYTLRITDAAGCVDIDQTTVVPAIANAGPDLPVCQGSNGVQVGTAPVASPSVVYSWTLFPSGSAAATLSCTNCAQPVANPGATTTYRLTVTVTRKDGTTCSSFDDVVVTVVAAPNGLLNFAGTDKTICSGSTVTLGGASAAAGFTYVWTPGQYLSSTTIYNPVFDAGTNAAGCPKIYSVTATSSGCSFTDEVIVNVVEGGISDQATTVCGPLWVHGTGSNCGAATTTWSRISGTGSILQTDNDGASAYLQSSGGASVFRRTTTLNGVTCTADITVNGNCANPCDFQITTQAVQGCPKVFGAGSSFGLTITGIDTSVFNFSWSPANMVSRPNGAKVIVNSSTYTTLTVTATNKYDPSITCSKSIVINNPAWSLPVFNTSTKTGCPNSPVAIGNPTVVGYSYSWSPAAGLSSVTTSNPTATLATSQVYSYQVTDISTGCMTTGDVPVNIVPVVANSGNDRAVCNGGTVTLGTTPPIGSNFTYSWQPIAAAYTNGTGPTDAQPQVLFATGSQVFTLTVTDPVSGCSNTDDVTLHSIVVTGEYAGAGSTVCPLETVQLGREPEQFATYQWTLSNDAPAPGLSCTNCANPTLIAPDVTTTYKVKVSYPGCSTPLEDLVTITVSTAPAFDLINKTFCPTSAVAIGFGAAGNPAARAGVSTYSWSPSSGLSSTTVANPTTNIKVVTDYVVTVTYTNGCVRTDSVKITPSAVADAKPDIMICAGQSAQIGTPAVAGMTYSWSGGPFVGPSNIAQPTVNPVATTTYTVSVTGSGCTTTDQMIVTVNSPANFDITGNTAICVGGTATVRLSSAPAANTVWQWSPTQGVADPTNPNTTIAASDTATYRLTQTNMTTGCSNYKEVVIVVRPNNISASAADISVCAGQATPMQLNVTPVGTYQYVWQSSTGLSNAYVANPSVVTSFERTYAVTVTDNTTKCQAVDSVQVTIKPEEECYPPVTLSGNVFHDANALRDAQVNPTSAIPIPSGFYVTLVNAVTGSLVATTAVAPNGAYNFGITPAGSYKVVLHQTPTGSASPSVPSGWMNTGENLNLGVGSDNGVDGVLTNVEVAAVNVTNANLAVQQQPVSDAKTYVIDQPVIGQEITLNGTHINTGPGTSSPNQLTGNDLEDGVLNGSTNRSLVITSLPAQGELWYNGAQVTPGQRIINYNSNLLVVKLTGTGYINYSFNYSYLDAAGVESTPASYTIQWGFTLPVRLVSFHAVKYGSSSILTWETATEENSDHFVIERSGNGLNWEGIGSLNAAGNSSSVATYRLTDHQPLRGVNYYRLKMVNKDGRFTVSETRWINFGDEKNTVGIFPNPTRNVAKLVFAKPPQSNITVKILNNLGQIIQTYNLTGSRETYNLNVKNIAPGIYHVTVNGAGINEHIKLMIE
jgi:hypothetical protein